MHVWVRIVSTTPTIAFLKLPASMALEGSYTYYKGFDTIELLIVAGDWNVHSIIGDHPPSQHGHLIHQAPRRYPHMPGVVIWQSEESSGRPTN